jgi:c-di-GMP-binding flagellar brake protein YcgR
MQAQPMSQYEFSPAPRESRAHLIPTDLRASVRKVMRVRARITVEGEAPLETDTIDLSHGGLSITSRQPLNLGQECSIELGISVPELAAPPVLRAAVRYCVRLREGEYRIGLKFVFVSIEAAELIVAALS